MTGHDVCLSHSMPTEASHVPIDLVAVIYVQWSVSGVELGIYEVGMACVAGSGSMVWCCVCVSHDQNSI